MVSKLEQRWKVIWITGASSGIGAALVERLAASGAKIAASARTVEKLDLLTGRFDNVYSFPLDVIDAAAVSRCAKDIEAKLGPIDLAILNAGISAASTTARPDAELFRAIIETNYLGVTNSLSVLVPKMTERGTGHICWVASLAGYNGIPGAGAYNASKAALVSLAEASKLELAAKGIDVTIVNPGFVRTPLTEKNKFAMPFLVEPTDAARRIIKGLIARKFEVTFPWQLTRFVKLLRLMPYPVFFWIVANVLMPRRKS